MKPTQLCAFDLEGQDAPRANSGTNYSGGPLRGWNELEFIPCRIVLQPGSNQVVTINFDHTKNSSIVKRGIQNLFTFTQSSNVHITPPVLTGANAMEEWYYTFTADVTNNQTGYVYFFARMSGGAHLFGGSSLDLFYSPLQIMKPGPVPGNPDLIVTKTGPATVLVGNSYTYSLTFSNKATATATAIGVQLSDFLPPGTSYVSGSATADAGVTNLTVEAGQLYWDVFDMPPGTSGTVTYQVQVPLTFPNGTVIKNYAQIESAQDDANEADNISIVTTTVVNSPPAATPDIYSIYMNQVLNMSAPGVLANDSDANSFSLKSVVVTNASSGALTWNTNGAFTYTPNQNFVGTDAFYYIATNGYTASQPTKVTINVLQMIAPTDTNVSCLTLALPPATNLAQYVAQGGVASGPYCGQPTTITFMGDTSNGASGCPASPLIISRAYQLTTGCGDVTNVVQKITVIDSTVPAITSFPPDATYTCSSQVPAAEDSLVTTADNCSGTKTVTHDADVITAGSCANRYTITRTYRVSDSCGNQTSQTQHITISDDTAPVITMFPPDATYSCANNVPTADNALVTATDNCNGSVTITHNSDSVASSNCVNRLTITRTYIATDSCGNSTSRTQTITVNGTTSPTITAFPSDATYSCAASVPVANDTLITATNACGGSSGVTITHTADIVSSSNCVNRFTIRRTYVATDACLNSSSRTQIITVNGTTAPTIASFPANATYTCASAVPSASNSLVTATDNCGGSATVTISHDADVITSSNCINHFTITRTYRATDACGNVTSKSQVITVNGTTPPTISAFPADATYSCSSAVPSADNTLVTAIDNCGSLANLVVTHDADQIAASNCVNHFTITRTYRVTDACGNATTKNQTITVNDTNVPSITAFPPDATYSCASAVPSADDSLVTVTDNCGGAAAVHITHNTDVISSSNCVNHFTITRTYRITDACGNAITRNQTLTVNGTTPPTIATFPNDATYSCASAVPVANDSSVTANAACGGNLVSITHSADVVTSTNCANRFTIKRTYIATDACGNSSSKSQLITVNAITPPLIATFPPDATYGCASAVPAANNSLVTATDTCGGANALTITHATDVITSSNCVNRFTITRTYIATDICGNSTSRNQVITVNGTNAPTITSFPANATYSCASAIPAADNTTVTATNACGATDGMTVTHSIDLVTSSNCVNRFTVARTYIAIDACGNSTSKTQTITVNGTTAPTITTFPSDANYSCAASVPLANDSLVSSTDNCGGSATITHDADVISSSNCPNHFTITRRYRATDACGNFTSRTQTITVDDQTAPWIQPPFLTNATYSCADSVPPANDSLIHAIDNCGNGVLVTHDSDVITSSNCVNRFTIRRVYHVTDSCGNSANVVQTINVNSTIVPVITAFPSDATFTCASAVPVANDTLVSATDGCGGNGVHISHAADAITSSTCDNRYTIRRTYTATDACGNSTSRSQIITINNTTPPTITSFPSDATYSCAGEVPTPNNTLVIATNACGDKFGMVITHSADVISSSNCVSRFTITRTYIATDACGNSSSKSQHIVVNATTPPTITAFPSDATYSCANIVPSANDSLVTATDHCGGSSSITITHDPDIVSSSNCVNRLTITRTYHATDLCGNAVAKTQVITVNATTPPLIATFPDDATYSCATAVPSADDTLVTGADGCGASASLVISHLPDTITGSNCVNRFTIARTYIATDACGNSASKTQVITVNGTTPPTITTFPRDITVACADSVPTANDSLIEAIDHCGDVSKIKVTHDEDVTVASVCANQFTIARTYRVTDACGNATSKTQTITVRDIIAPQIECPPGFTVSLFENVPGPNSEAVVATDNCSVPLKSFVGETFVTNNNIVTITRTFAATDDCGNSATCSQVIIMDPYLATPTANPDSYTTLENQTLNIAAVGILANDIDPNNLPLRVLFVAGPTNGVLTLNTDGSFQYVPNTFYAGDDSFVYQITNGGMTSAPVTVSLTVVFVNQPPSFTAGPNQVVNNYASAQTRAGWATDIYRGPSNESSQTLHFNVSNDNNFIFSVQPTINPNGTLSYAPAAGHYGTATVTATLQDNGGTANGGNDTSPIQKFSIIVNNPPAVTINSPTNTSLFLYPTPVDIVATATDLDGTVTDVTFFNGTNAIGQGTPTGNNTFTFIWTNAPSSNSVLYALATDNYGATNLSSPVNIELGNPVVAKGGLISFSPSLYSWGQKISVTNPTISIVKCVTITFTSIQPDGATILGITGTNELGQPYIMLNNTIPPVTGIDNYATILYVAPSKPAVTFTTSANLQPGPGFTVNATNVVPLTANHFQTDGSFLINFLSVANRTYYVQYSSDLKTWFTSPIVLRGTGTQLQWVDVGPNTTESKPSTAPTRIYRVVGP